MSERHAEELVASAAARTVEIPEELAWHAAEQNRHLVELAASLIDSGMDEPAVKDVLRKAMASYERELVKTVMRLAENRRER